MDSNDSATKSVVHFSAWPEPVVFECHPLRPLDRRSGHDRFRVPRPRQLSSRILNLSPPLGVSVTVVLMPGGSAPSYLGRRRRKRDSATSLHRLVSRRLCNGQGHPTLSTHLEAGRDGFLEVLEGLLFRVALTDAAGDGRALHDPSAVLIRSIVTVNGI
jgi:hypothetical protein